MQDAHRFVAAALAGVLSTTAAAAPDAASTPDDVNARLGLARSAVIGLEMPDPPGAPLRRVIEIEGETLTLELTPVSVRSPDYRVYTVGVDGIRHETKPASPRTLRGEVLETPGSVVAASALEDGLSARIERDGAVHWIEPLARHFPERMDLAGLHVVYADADVLETGLVCGTTVKHLVDRAPARLGGDGTSAPGELYEAELACDADFQYFQDYGSTQAVENRINAVINQMNVQYERDVQITHRITAIIVRTSPVYTSTNPNTLLSEFRSRWNANHGGIPRDVAHLFTGKNLNGGVIGIALIGVICDIPNAYGLVESDFNNVFACATDLSAHELGHNWNAGHCGCPSHTMNSGITCSNQFSQASIDAIIAFRNSRDCLDEVECPEDLDDSGSIDFGDVLAILAAWGNAGGPEDLDESGFVDFGDVLVVLGAWGECP